MTRNATGPKTAAGKAVSSQNARRHGLSAPPEEYLVTAWFNLILNNGEDAVEEPNADDPRRGAALLLAIAEARYHHALHKVDTQDTDPNSVQQAANKLYAEVRFVLDGLPQRVADGPADPCDLEYAEFGLRQVEKLLVEVERECRLYRRYLGEARAQRRKALKACRHPTIKASDDRDWPYSRLRRKTSLIRGFGVPISEKKITIKF